MGNDIYMGGVRFTPDFDDMGAPQEQWYELSGGSGKGKVMIALAYQPSTVSSASVCSIDTHPRFRFPFRVILLSSCLYNVQPLSLDLGIFGHGMFSDEPKLGSHLPKIPQPSTHHIMLQNSVRSPR